MSQTQDTEVQPKTGIWPSLGALNAVQLAMAFDLRLGGGGRE